MQMRTEALSCRIAEVSYGFRAWSGATDTDAMQALARRCWPDGLHPGGIGWAQATRQLAQEIVLVDDSDGELLGWAGVTQPGFLVMQVESGRTELRRQLIEWLLVTALGPKLSIDVFDDETLHDLVRVGFEPTSPPFGYYRMGHLGLRAATDQVTAAAPTGYVIRSTRPGEADDRVAVHRSAWRPADLPFHPDYRPEMDESWSSSFTIDDYRRVQSTCLYSPDFDLVVVAPDGTLAGCCIGWFDPSMGWAEIEPVGVVPDHRRRGLAVALCAEVARRVSRSGGQHLFINTGASEMYPAPYDAYRKAGFTPFIRATTLTRDSGRISGG